MIQSLMPIPMLAVDAAGEQPSLFEGTPWQSVAAILAFLILLAVLSKYAWNPIITALQQREDKIKADLESAEQARADAEATLAGYKQQLADARKEAQKMIEQSRGEAQKVADHIKQDAEREITHIRQRAQDEIGTAREQAVADVYAHAATLATQIAGRILQREISEDDQRQLVEQSLDELGRTQNV